MNQTVYVLMNTYHGDTRIDGVVSDKAIAERFAIEPGNYFETVEIDACLKSDLSYLTRPPVTESEAST